MSIPDRHISAMPCVDECSFSQDWATTEGNLHRALAACVVERARSNKGGRLASSFKTSFLPCMHDLSRALVPGKGRDRMSQLKELVHHMKTEQA